MAYRLGEVTVKDPEFETLTLEGDGFAAAGELATLLVNPVVQRRLRMSPEEAAQAPVIANAYRDSLRQLYAGREWRPPHVDPLTSGARAELESRMAALLGPDRTEQLKRLSWRIRPGDALLEREVAEALGLTAEQREELARIAEANEAAAQAVLHKIRPVRLSSHDSVEAMGRDAEAQGQERLLARLTTEQRERLERLRQGRR